MSDHDDKPVDDDDAGDTTVVGMTSPISALLKAQKIAWLEHMQGPGAGQKILIGDNAVVVGRATQADIQIDSAHLSRMHVRFTKSGPQVRFEDLDSANGVYLNGTKAHSAVLHEGDTVQIGDAVFLFHEGN